MSRRWTFQSRHVTANIPATSVKTTPKTEKTCWRWSRCNQLSQDSICGRWRLDQPHSGSCFASVERRQTCPWRNEEGVIGRLPRSCFWSYFPSCNVPANKMSRLSNKKAVQKGKKYEGIITILLLLLILKKPTTFYAPFPSKETEMDSKRFIISTSVYC